MAEPLNINESISTYFHPLRKDVSGTELPEKFTFPFYYTPHTLAVEACVELQEHLETQKDWEHNFGLDKEKEGLAIGKMFGVLVVKTTDGQLGYLAAFSGKLAESNHIRGFVPTVFDMLTEGSFFRVGEEEVNKINRSIEALEIKSEYLFWKELYEKELKDSKEILQKSKDRLRDTRKERKARRKIAEAELSASDYEIFAERLKNESLRGQFMHKSLIIYWERRVGAVKKGLDKYADLLSGWKKERKEKSFSIQQELFKQYTFLSAQGEEKSLLDIFKSTVEGQPPAGAGECAAPKLLHFAYKHNLRPIAIAEFWWGAPMRSEVRLHKQYYPACRGKCEPILGHMLQGLEVDDNPMLENTAEGKQIEIIYEDDHLVVVNKPAEFLSVPGRNVSDSLQTRMEEKYPEAKNNLIVHRLDMSTSGILVMTKTAKAHQLVQKQFAERTVKKRYVALLEGTGLPPMGEINLPLRVNLENRPRQIVDDVHGKPARTVYKVMEEKEGRTLIHFFPVTGRTHQLRVHAAHQLGLGMPIVGDDLYGNIDTRLHLHAEHIKFVHPITERNISFYIPADF